MGKKPIISVTYENERISIKKKKQLTLHKMCVTPLLCGPWADVWPFYRLYSGKRFSVSNLIQSRKKPFRCTQRLYSEK